MGLGNSKNPSNAPITDVKVSDAKAPMDKKTETKRGSMRKEEQATAVFDSLITATMELLSICQPVVRKHYKLLSETKVSSVKKADDGSKNPVDPDCACSKIFAHFMFAIMCSRTNWGLEFFVRFVDCLNHIPLSDIETLLRREAADNRDGSLVKPKQQFEKLDAKTEKHRAFLKMFIATCTNFMALITEKAVVFLSDHSDMDKPEWHSSNNPFKLFTRQFIYSFLEDYPECISLLLGDDGPMHSDAKIESEGARDFFKQCLSGVNSAYLTKCLELFRSFDEEHLNAVVLKDPETGERVLILDRPQVQRFVSPVFSGRTKYPLF